MINKKLILISFVFLVSFLSLVKADTLLVDNHYLRSIINYKHEISHKKSLINVFFPARIIYCDSGEIFLATQGVHEFLNKVRHELDGVKGKKLTEVEDKDVENKLFMELKDYFATPAFEILDYLNSYRMFFKSIVEDVFKSKNIDIEKSILVKFVGTSFRKEDLGKGFSKKEQTVKVYEEKARFDDFFIKELDTFQKAMNFCSELDIFLTSFWMLTSPDIKKHSLGWIKAKNLKTDAEIEVLKNSSYFAAVFGPNEALPVVILEDGAKEANLLKKKH